MAVRDFDGVDDFILCNGPALAGTTVGSLIAVVSRQSTGTWDACLRTTNGSGTASGTLGLGSDGNPYFRWGGREAFAPNWHQTNATWHLYCGAINGTTIRWHRRNLSTNVNSHGNPGFASGSGASTGSGGRVYLGVNTNTEWGDVRIATVGVLPGVFIDDTMFNAITGTDDIIALLGSDGFVADLNQASTSDPVVDFGPNGYTQSSISGTAVITGDDPPNWTFHSTAAPEQELDGGGARVTVYVGGGLLVPGAATIDGGGVEVGVNVGGGRLLPGAVTQDLGGIEVGVHVGGGAVIPAPVTIDGGGVFVSALVGGGELLPQPALLDGGGVQVGVRVGGGSLVPGDAIIRPSGLLVPVSVGGGELLPQKVTLDGGGASVSVIVGGGRLTEFVPGLPPQRMVRGVGE